MSQYQKTIYSTLVSLAVGALASSASAQVENETHQIKTTDSTASEFSYSLAVDNGLIAAGATGDNFNGSFSGSAFLFDLQTGEQLMKFVLDDGVRNDRLGNSIALENGILAVGAPQGSSLTGDTGHAYLFDANPDSPTFGDLLATLAPNDGSVDDEFGHAIAMSNGVVVVGSPFHDDLGADSGSVYLFDADPASPNFGNQLAELSASDASAADEFGFSVAIDNGLLVVGAQNNTTFSGAAYIFDANPQSPQFGDQLALLFANGIVTTAEFGRAVSIDNYIVAAGARGDGLGAVYLFNADPQSPNFGSQTHKLSVGFEDVPGWFGNAVAINGGRVAVGSQLGNDDGFGSGVAFVFDASTGEKIAHYLPSDGASFGQFGFSTAMTDDGVAVIGAMGGVAGNQNRGAAYVFDGPLFVCTADLTDDGQLNFFDISVFLTLFQFNDPAADFNNDGNWNFFDVSAFLTAFTAGCP